jgi:hypothetical protein
MFWSIIRECSKHFLPKLQTSFLPCLTLTWCTGSFDMRGDDCVCALHDGTSDSSLTGPPWINLWLPDSSFWLLNFPWQLPPISMTNLLQAVDFWYGKIQLTYYKRSIFDMERFWQVVWANLTSCIFSPFFFLIPLYIILIYGVFINKVLQVCNNWKDNRYPLLW